MRLVRSFNDMNKKLTNDMPLLRPILKKYLRRNPVEDLIPKPRTQSNALKTAPSSSPSGQDERFLMF